MSVRTVSNLPKNQIQRTRNAIRRSWSPTERDHRHQLDEAKQQRLYSLLLAHETAVPARVA